MADTAAFSILRIKRKRTANQLPLDALVIEQPEPSTKRRKATHSSAPAVPPTSRGIFRFAETVSIDSFDNPTKTRQVKDRIQSFLTRPLTTRNVVSNLVEKEQRPLARIPSSASLRHQTSSTPASAAPSPPSTPTLKTGRKLPSSAAALVSHPPPIRGGPSVSTSASASAYSPAPLLERKRTRYRIVTEPPPLAASSNVNVDAAAVESSSCPLSLTPKQVEQLELARRDDELYLAEVREADEVRRGLRPPTVMSRAERDERTARDERRRVRAAAQQAAAELERLAATADANKAASTRTRIYDAIAEDDDDDEDFGQGGGRSTRSVKKKRVARDSRGGRGVNWESAAERKKVEDETMMDNFGDMLKEYLTLQDSTARDNTIASDRFSPKVPIPETPTQGSEDEDEDDDKAAMGEESDSGGDFVYDVYYRDLREPTASGSSNGLTSLGGGGSGGSHGHDVGSLEGLKRIGELAGLEEDEDLLLRVDGEGDSETEEEDNADQDSNEENDYRNDYPDEESEDEDRWDQDDDDDDDEGDASDADDDY